jgi:hypothetical protein
MEEEKRNDFQGFGRETEAKSPTRKTRYRWEDNIKSNLKVI